MASYASSTADSTSTGTTDEMNEPLSILQPLSYSANSCGYCAEVKGARSRAKSSKSYGAWAHALSAGTYKALLDRGWRRSGCYMYKPDMRNTCCPQYTISLDAGSFKPSRSQRQVLARFNAFVKTGERDGQPGWGTQASQEASTSGTSRTAAAAEKGGNDVAMGEAVPAKKKDKGRGKGKANQAEAADWGESVHAGDWDRSPQDEPFKHRFEFTLEPASYTDEKFQLFKRYQMEVHEEPASKVSEKGFRRFLVDTPLDIEPTASPDHSYGSHHGLWRLDGRLIAFAVLDLLPGAVSSVYFVWDPDYSGMSLGKLSALREAQMVREMEKAGLWSEGSGRYMMGFYIHTCPKMRYKADYQPSFLLEPDTNRYVPWAQCKPLLDLSSRILSFTDPPPPASSVAAATTSAHPVAPPTPPPEDASMAHLDDEMDEDDEAAYPSPPPPGCLDPHELPKDLLIESFVLEKRTLMPLLLSSAWHDPVTQIEVRELLATTGDAGKGKLAIWTGR
ncbi:Arginyl-tRNA--protein transferase 1 [Rhodotorula toruloides]|uniref:arginyltransferase n=1 Tax=Rhodotorula toruloides TaxID=5286 RepID=A0A2T0AGG3_RHOTO|nr:Arginine-tRNA-protein transferase, C terminus-domain containing protein [Rhodotorula toruloides]